MPPNPHQGLTLLQGKDILNREKAFPVDSQP